MKTKLFFTAFLLFSCIELSFSQEYHPFLNNSSWVITNTVSCCRPMIVRTISEGTDVVIGDYTYKQFIDAFPQNVVLIREDVVAKRVYKLIDGVDKLLYDFSLETGDTIDLSGRIWTATVETIPVNNGSRKKITLLSYSEQYHHYLKQIWIEGVGSDKPPFDPTNNMYNFMSAGGGVMLYTACGFQNGEQVYGDADSCALMLSTTSETYSEQSISFTPNPFTTTLTIDSGIDLQDAGLMLYNLQGQLVMETKNLKGKKITVNSSNLSKGMYFARLLENGKLVKVAKLMVD